jgi:hypothetical protein
MDTVKTIIRKILRPARLAAGKFVILPSFPWTRDQTKMNQENSIIYKAARLIAAEKVPGDYLEFGAYTGSSFASAYQAIERVFDEYSIVDAWSTEQDVIERRQLWQSMRFLAFDSFEGLPAPKGVDTQSRDFVPGKFAISQRQFEENIRRAGVPRERTIIVPGWFADTLTDATIRAHNLRHAAIVHVDSDLYESAKAVLEFVTGLLVDGTVIIFDDWYTFGGNPYLGEQLAWREWCAAHPEWTAVEYQKEGSWRNSFIVNRTNNNPRDHAS